MQTPQGSQSSLIYNSISVNRLWPGLLIKAEMTVEEVSGTLQIIENCEIVAYLSFIMSVLLRSRQFKQSSSGFLNRIFFFLQLSKNITCYTWPGNPVAFG